MAMDQGAMLMREVPASELRPKTVTALHHNARYHHHLMLNFERMGSQTVKVWVQPPCEAAVSEHKH